MTKKTILWMSATLIAVSVSVAISACGKKDGFANPGTVRQYLGTQSPGDAITWTLDYGAGTFVGVNDGGTTSTSDDLTFSGTMATLPSGFVKLTVTASSDTAKIGIGETAYGLEAPGLVFIVKPNHSGSHVNVSVNKDPSCDGIAGDYNWIQAGFKDPYDVTTGDVYGTATLSFASGLLNVSGTKKTLAGADAGTGLISPPPATACSGGQVNWGSDQGVLQASASGGLIIDGGSNGGGIVGFKQSGITMADVAGKTYTGVLFKHSATGDDTKPVQATFGAASGSTASGGGHEFTDVEAGTVSATEGVTISLTGITNGLVSGMLGTEPLHAAAYVAGSTTVLFLVSKDSGSSDPYNVLLVSQ